MLVVQQIDRALKRLYNINTQYCAENFLITQLPVLNQKKAGSKDLKGALYIHCCDSNSENDEPIVDLGIYLSEEVRSDLESFGSWELPWNHRQLQAFAVAAEEVSHFHCLVYNLERNRPVSQFELEFQAEIDKFFLLFFSDCISTQDKLNKFDLLFQKLFFDFSLIQSLSGEQIERYRDATLYARKVIREIRKDLIRKGSLERAILIGRYFYQQDLAGKVAFSY